MHQSSICVEVVIRKQCPKAESVRLYKHIQEQVCLRVPHSPCSVAGTEASLMVVGPPPPAAPFVIPKHSLGA